MELTAGIHPLMPTEPPQNREKTPHRPYPPHLHGPEAVPKEDQGAGRVVHVAKHLQRLHEAAHDVVESF